MTSQESCMNWKDLSAGRLLVSSKLQSAFLEHLNAEVALGTVHDAQQAVMWFDSTFWGVQTPRENIAAAHVYITAELHKLGQFLSSHLLNEKQGRPTNKHSSRPRSHDRRLRRQVEKLSRGRSDGEIWHEGSDGVILHERRCEERIKNVQKCPREIAVFHRLATTRGSA